MADDKMVDKLKSLANLSKSDLYIYFGDISEENATNFIITVKGNKTDRTNVVLILATLGGEADAAYRIASYLKSVYKKITVYILGLCKSAGTLIACGADEIVFSDFGELGPLDVQLMKADELTRTSGLCYSQAIAFLQNQAFSVFEDCLLNIKQRSGGSITTKTAAEVGEKIAVGLLAPISGQIDPMRLGEFERAARIAFEYGRRLCGNERIIHRLISGYPSHEFVIDFNEAKKLFGKNTRKLNHDELFLEYSFLEIARKPIEFANYFVDTKEDINDKPIDSNNGNNSEPIKADGKNNSGKPSNQSIPESLGAALISKISATKQ